MNCAEIARLVHVDLDGEFGAEERLELEQHLEECPSCAELARSERAYVGRLRDTLHTNRTPAPAALAARIDRALDEVDRPRVAPLSRMTAWSMPAAALAVVLVSVWLVRHPDEPAEHLGAQALIGDAVARHERELPIEVQGPDPEQVRTWFQGKLDVPVRPPMLRQPQAHLVGGRLSHLGERQAAYLVYDLGGSKVSVFIFDPQDLATGRLRRRNVHGRDVWVGGAHGYNVAVVNDGGLGYAFTSDLSENRMLDVVSTAFSR